MNYAIIWLEEAEEQLADLWMRANDPKGINEYIEFVERLLGYAPLDFGESRGGNDRIILSGPVGLIYRVDEANRTVQVVTVGSSGGRR